VTAHYLDASAWVKRYVRDSGTERILELFDREDAFACASLGFIEVSATLARKHRAGSLDEAELNDALHDLEHDWQTFLKVQLDVDVQAVALDAARRHALRGADTVHLASVVLLRRYLPREQTVVVTSDGELKTAALAEGFKVLDPAVEERRAPRRPPRA
jgi:uncharacterized protein